MTVRDPYAAIYAAAYRSLAPHMPEWACGGLTVEQMDHVAQGRHPTGRPMAAKWGEFCFGCAHSGRGTFGDVCVVEEGRPGERIQSEWPACAKWRRG